MESLRFILLISLGLVLVLLWNAWQQDYGPAKISQAQTTPGKKPAAEIPSAEPVPANVPAVSPGTTGAKLEEGVIEVTTDTYKAYISLRGGSIVSLDLLKFPVSLKQKDKPVRLLGNEPQFLYLAQGGLLSNNPAPTHDSHYTSPIHAFVLDPDAESLEVPLYWESGNGISVKKTYKFLKSRYLISVQYEVLNNSDNAWSGAAYGQLQRTEAEKQGSFGIYTYTGAVISGPENRYEKISFDDIRKDNLSRTIINGWAAMMQHYFLTAIIPDAATEGQHYYSLFVDKERSGKDADRFVIGLATPRTLVSPGESKSLQHKFYIGPKIQGDLEKIAPGLELTVDYGMLWFIAKPLFWCLQKFHALTGNWGMAIILVTLMLKILFYNLSAAGYRSMARMRKVQPRLLAIRDRYKDDRARLNKAMMDIYKEEKINPLGGCFPILVQIPVFIALYWVLLESIELRQADFGLWIHDLSNQDPYFVLPVIMGLTMLVQQKLNPAPVDPVQEKVMMMLPFVFTVFFAFFPSGLVLYWVVNNILSIAQQWLITRNIERAGLKS